MQAACAQKHPERSHTVMWIWNQTTCWMPCSEYKGMRAHAAAMHAAVNPLEKNEQCWRSRMTNFLVTLLKQQKHISLTCVVRLTVLCRHFLHLYSLQPPHPPPLSIILLYPHPHSRLPSPTLLSPPSERMEQPERNSLISKPSAELTKCVNSRCHTIGARVLFDFHALGPAETVTGIKIA